MLFGEYDPGVRAYLLAGEAEEIPVFPLWLEIVLALGALAAAALALSA